MKKNLGVGLILIGVLVAVGCLLNLIPKENQWAGFWLIVALVGSGFELLEGE